MTSFPPEGTTLTRTETADQASEHDPNVTWGADDPDNPERARAEVSSSEESP